MSSVFMVSQVPLKTIWVKILLNDEVRAHFDQGLWMYTLLNIPIRWFPGDWSLKERKHRERFCLVWKDCPEAQHTQRLTVDRVLRKALRTSFDIDNKTYNWSRGDPLRNKSPRHTNTVNEDSSSKTCTRNRPRENPRKEYSLVIEYADNGTLRNYLKENFKNLNWNDKYKLAFQLVHAVSCLHDEGIIHRDLHSSNVLIHQHTVKLSGFGLSKRIEETSNSQSKAFGLIPHQEIPCDETRGIVVVDQGNIYGSITITPLYLLNKKSDVYSIGVLLWEVSSGQPPFHGTPYDVGLAISILQGLRETPVPETSENYIKIYTDCWNIEPDNRPLSINSIEIGKQEVLNYFNNQNIILQEINDLLLNNQNNPNYIFLLGKFNHLGIGIDIDKKKAFELYQKAADLGNTDGITNLGHCYLYGYGTDIDKKKAFELYQKAANLRNSVAQDNLAFMYENGEGIIKDISKAIYWYEKSAKQGNQDAQNKLKTLL
ncbi:hypothetical protein RclHR1_15150002 [Rhizophagus clarus]|uniref:Protein kinase domain-containing protein n=1 Tax=Rhizophagus clarus TaxID=94130 RepID=A0A2Z6QEG3_9GLOM|nr:hypothetical protein RclHR1_15150002 [Rhizophagus clarus]